MISETLGIEGRKLLTPEDEYEALREFNAGYEGERSLLENLQLELQELLKNIPDLKERLDSFPSSIFSGRAVPKKGTTGVFFLLQVTSLGRGFGRLFNGKWAVSVVPISNGKRQYL